MRLNSRLGVVAALVVAFAMLGSVAAYAVATYRTGTSTVRQFISTQTDAWNVPGPNTWQTIPNTGLAFNTTARRLITARFSAESLCQGGGWCSVRVVYSRNGGPLVELSPASGTDYAFDAADDLWEQHTVERTSANYVPAGNIRVSAQAQRVNGAGSFRLDDYHFVVGLIAP